MKKSIILSGCFYGTNYGDHLFCEIFNKVIQSKVKVKNTSDFIKETTECESATDFSIFTAKAVVFASGGYMGEGDSENIIKKVRRLRQHFIPGIFCRILNIPYCVIGVGVGPNKHWLTRKIIKFIINGADRVTVRDEESKRFLKTYGVLRNDIVVTTDTAVIVPDLYKLNDEDKYTNQLFKNATGMKKVFFHVDPSNYTNRDILYEEIVNFVNRDKNIYLIVGSDMISGVLEDEKLKQSFYSNLPKERTLFVEYESPMQFTSLLKNVDAIITHKLHVGILGTAYNKSVVSFPIHNKVIRYYKQINAAERCLPLQILSKAQIKDHIESNLYKDFILDNKYRNNSKMNISILNDFINSVENKM